MRNVQVDDSTTELVQCPVRHRPVFRIVLEGIEVKCKFCGGDLHIYSQEEIEARWALLKSQANDTKQSFVAK